MRSASEVRAVYEPTELIDKCRALLADEFTDESDFENELARAFLDLWFQHYLPAHDRAEAAEQLFRETETVQLATSVFATAAAVWLRRPTQVGAWDNMMVALGSYSQFVEEGGEVP